MQKNISPDQCTDKGKSATNEQVRKDPKTNKQDIIFNYSRIVLSEPMEKLINRGLNFSVLPKKLDIT